MGKKNSAGMELTDGQLAKIAEAASRVAIEEYHREAEKTRQENKDCPLPAKIDRKKVKKTE